MDYDLTCALNGFHRLLYDMRPGLGKNLDGYSVRNDIVIYQVTAEIIVSLGCSRETDLDLFESYLAKEFEELDLLVKSHRNFQCLITVPEIDRTPYRCFCDPLRRPFTVRKIYCWDRSVFITVHLRTTSNQSVTDR